MKVFLDDERTPPIGWILTRWPEEAIELLKSGQVEELSLDHDLGDHGDARNGYSVLLWIEEAVTRGFTPPPIISIHSANASARQKMLAAVQSIRRLAAR